MLSRYTLHAALLISGCAALAATPPKPDGAGFDARVKPYLRKNCYGCHNAKLSNGNLDLTSYASAESALKDRDRWEVLLEKLRKGEMPPKPLPRPKAEETAAAAGWIETEFTRLDRAAKPDPGRVTARRLNRYEYNNTIRDLLAVDFRPADSFPADDSGYGFDNIGDVLSLSPVLLEKYLSAADKISKAAIVTGPAPKATQVRYKREQLPRATRTRLQTEHRFNFEGEYELRVGLGGALPLNAPPVMQVGLWFDGEPLKTFDVQTGQDKRRTFDIRIPVKLGRHTVRAAFLDSSFTPVEKAGERTRPLMLDYIEVLGPYFSGAMPLPESHRRIMACGHAPGEHVAGCARRNLAVLARRAWRRPVSKREIEKLAGFVDMAQREGDSFEQGMRVGLQAVLVSPNFVYRIEHHPKPGDAAAVHAIQPFELASRLSYFLWASMPDDELLDLAGRKSLSKPEVLQAQVRRMLRDPRASALAENFGGQWLALRNLDSVKPDPERFQEFSDALRDSMREETQRFFENVVREDASILDFIDGRYTFLDERLARHYGISGVTGEEFRKVSLEDTPRGGVITQASVLTVSSYPTRTSPVIRGKYVLENLLGAPPPPPPPNVPALEEADAGVKGTLRQQLEQHRANPVCASCHSKMDPLGFGLENFDAIGRWRTRDGSFPIDATGTLPNGKGFDGPSELRRILMADKDDFTRCLAEKMLTYALGRGLERYDRPALRKIVGGTAAGDYKFSRLVIEICESMPFRMGRGDGGRR